ncbi:hypothetical protein ACVWZV_002184 [Bradyrhizobium sp. GM5.1]
MAKIECKSSQNGVASVWVELDNITDKQVQAARDKLDQHLAAGSRQPSDVVANAFVELTTTCPEANPSDLWHHVIYRHLLECGWNDARWKRVSGFALERALVSVYAPRLKPHNIRMHILSAGAANAILAKVGITDTKSTKVDLFIEGRHGHEWLVFGSAHVKSSIAERIQDDVPASLAFMQRNLLSILITLDMKSYPPPHGQGINYGELGGRSMAVEKERLKRGYIEAAGQFDGLFSFNLRTPPSTGATKSGKRIYTMSLHNPQPDELVEMLAKHWQSHKAGLKI